MKDTMRSTPPTLDRSTRNSLTTTTPISAAPVIHSARSFSRAATTMVHIASTLQKIDSAACTSMDRSIASRWNGTPAQ